MRVIARWLALVGAVAVCSVAFVSTASADHDPVHTYFGCVTTANTPYTSHGVVGGFSQVNCGAARQITLYACLQLYDRLEGYFSNLSCYYQEAIGDNRTSVLNAFPSAECWWSGLGLYRTYTRSQVFEGGYWYTTHKWSDHAYNCSGYG